MIKINNDMNNKDRRNDANRKPFNIPKIKGKYWDDLYVIINRLKSSYINNIFDLSRKSGMYIPQICVMIFKSDKYCFRPNEVYGVILTHYVNPRNSDDKIAMSILKKDSVISYYEENTKIPLKVKFLDQNMNNAILITFTEEEDMIDCEIRLMASESRPVFDYFKDIKFYEDFDPIKKGYIPYVLTSKVEGFKIVPGNYKIAK